MITEVYFIEGLYLYTEVGSGGRGVLASREQCLQVQLVVPGRVGRTLQKEVRHWTPYWWWIFKVNSQVKGSKALIAYVNR